MNKQFKTSQEEFWSGEFGNSYIQRNQSEKLLASNLNYFSSILEACSDVNSVLEFGANVGMNIKALRMLLPEARLAGIEINKTAYDELVKIENVTGYHQSIFDFEVKDKYDLAFIKGVLIHIDPTMLPTVYEKMYNSSSRYICIGEYYNPVPVALKYRGHDDKLFKRDFAGEFMDTYKDVELVKYGFAYHRDKLFPQDDINWFLLRKK